MQSTLFAFILAHSRRQQVAIVALTALAMPFYYASLEMPKLIVNRALAVNAPDYEHPLTIGPVVLGEPSRMEWLVILSGLFLLAITAHGACKFWLNVYKGRLGERLLYTLRHDLCGRVLNFSPERLARVSSDELNAVITAEADAIGGFMADAIAQPLLQGGLLATAVVFIFVQDFWLGVAALALFPIQAGVIPPLQRQVNVLGRERVRAVRRLAGRLGEAVDLLSHLRSSGATAHEHAVLDGLLSRILDIRYRIFKRKSFVKLLNNFLFQVSPFLLLLGGGVLVLRGELSVGALVGVLAAYKDLPPPARELLDYYQARHDAELRYEQIRLQFANGEAPVPAPPDAVRPGPTPAGGPVRFEDVVVLESDGEVVLRCPAASFAADESVAIVAAPDAAAAALCAVLRADRVPARGRTTFAGRLLSEIPGGERGKLLAVVDDSPSLFAGTIRDNLGYGAPEAPDDASMVAALAVAGLGYRSPGIALDARPTLAAAGAAAGLLVALREPVREAIAKTHAGACERYDPARLCEQLSLAENLIWGEPVPGGPDIVHLAENRHARRALRVAGLEPLLVRLGEAALRRAGDAPADVVGPEDAALVDPSRGGPLPGRKRWRRRALQSIALRLVPARHRYVADEPELARRMLHARRLFQEFAGALLPTWVAPFDPCAYNPALTVRENLLFGRVSRLDVAVREEIDAILMRVVDTAGLGSAVRALALDYDVGLGGRRLSAGQRRRLALASALVRDPSFLVVDRLDEVYPEPAARDLVERVLEARRGRGLVWILAHARLAAAFERRLTVLDGTLAEAPRRGGG